MNINNGVIILERACFLLIIHVINTNKKMNGVMLALKLLYCKTIRKSQGWQLFLRQVGETSEREK
jgi:hypothetical protein